MHSTESPTEKPLASLKAYLTNQSALTILRHFLGSRIHGAPDLLDEAVFVGLDMEWWEHKPGPITENGFAIVKGKDMLSRKPEDRILELFNKIEIYHLRIIESCHLTNRSLSPAAARNFQFGTTRWIHQSDAKTLVTELFTKWRCPDGSPAPVILLGHGLREDIKLLKLQWGIDIDGIDNIVYIMETSPLANQAQLIAAQNVKLELLIQGFGITPLWLHNAGNDIGYTTLVAILIGLKDELFPSAVTGGDNETALEPCFPLTTDVDSQPLNTIVETFVATRKLADPPSFGLPRYCYRCESTLHHRNGCTTEIEPCAICKAATGPKNRDMRARAKGHRTERCSCAPHVKYDPLPDWVILRLSKKQRGEFLMAKTLGDVETLGRLVLAAYPAVMRDEEEIDMEEKEKEGMKKDVGVEETENEKMEKQEEAEKDTEIKTKETKESGEAQGNDEAKEQETTKQEETSEKKGDEENV